MKVLFDFLRDRLAGQTSEPPDAAALNVLYDEQTTSIMRAVLSDDSNCVDVGCHQGTILDVMLACAPNGRHFGFEPIPSFCEQLKARYAERPNVQISCSALSETRGSSGFQYVTSNPAYSGLRQRRYDRDDETIEEIGVATDTLDHIIDRDTPIRLIKVDVEGGEVLFFRGALQTIARDRPYIVFEHGSGGADYYGHGPEDVHELLVEQCGLALSTMQGWLERKRPLSRRAFLDQFYGGVNYYFLAHP